MTMPTIITALLSLAGLYLRFKLGKASEEDQHRVKMTEAFLEDFNNVQAIDAALAGHGDTEWLERLRKKWKQTGDPTDGG